MIKANPNYNAAMGEALGIGGEDHFQPDLRHRPADHHGHGRASTVGIGWSWEGNGDFLDQCEIQVDRGTGAGFVMLTFDTTPNYTDTQPFPATPTKWIYQAVYRTDDQRKGLWSNPVSVTVGG